MTPSNELHSELNLLNLGDRRSFHTYCEMYKFLQLGSVSRITDKFTFVLESHTRSTRSVNNSALYQPRVRLELCKDNFVYRGGGSWSELPDDIKYSDSLDSFKVKLFKYVNRYHVNS